MDNIRTPGTPLLCESHAAFIQHGVSILVASRAAGNAPVVARASGCRVSADRCQVTVFLAADSSAAVLTDLEETGAIAVVFSRPSTHKTIQLKGSDARLGPLAAGDEILIQAYRESFVEDLLDIDWSRDFGRTLIPATDHRAVAVTFTPNAAFDQTPGPKAGRALA